MEWPGPSARIPKSLRIVPGDTITEVLSAPGSVKFSFKGICRSEENAHSSMGKTILKCLPPGPGVKMHGKVAT